MIKIINKERDVELPTLPFVTRNRHTQELYMYYWNDDNIEVLSLKTGTTQLGFKLKTINEVLDSLGRENEQIVDVELIVKDQ